MFVVISYLLIRLITFYHRKVQTWNINKNEPHEPGNTYYNRDSVDFEAGLWSTSSNSSTPRASPWVWAKGRAKSRKPLTWNPVRRKRAQHEAKMKPLVFNGCHALLPILIQPIGRSSQSCKEVKVVCWTGCNSSPAGGESHRFTAEVEETISPSRRLFVEFLMFFSSGDGWVSPIWLETQNSWGVHMVHILRAQIRLLHLLGDGRQDDGGPGQGCTWADLGWNPLRPILYIISIQDPYMHNMITYHLYANTI